MQNVLVIGGAGYVGSHACKALAQAGYAPVAFDDLSTGHEWAVRWGPFEKGSILDPSALDDALRKYDPVAVIHFAARISVSESVQKPDEYSRINVDGSRNVLAAMERSACRTIVYSSSAAVYAGTDRETIPETAPLAPNNPYGETKKAVEELLGEYARDREFQAVALRYFNASGADADAEIGEDHEPETHLIPLAIRCALGLAPGLSVFGDDYPTPDGTCVRDYVHVADLAEAHVSAMKRALERPGFEVFNTGGGAGHSVRDVIETVKRVAGRDFPVETAARRDGDVARLVADITRARDVLGWRPVRSGLETIVGTAWHWHRKHHGGA